MTAIFCHVCKSEREHSSRILYAPAAQIMPDGRVLPVSAGGCQHSQAEIRTAYLRFNAQENLLVGD